MSHLMPTWLNLGPPLTPLECYTIVSCGFFSGDVVTFTVVTCQAGMSGYLQRWSHCPQMGQIWDFFRSDFSTFWLGSPSQNVLKSDLKKSPICPIYANPTHFGVKLDIPAIRYCRFRQLTVDSLPKLITCNVIMYFPY